uniref:nucleotidyltransferase family protein n=1 Tax=Marinobacterium profundum TaxID=1714300 RepID=UPI000834A982|nr:nucleotidyltransferase family protein [Marinobacterium profundum]
MSSDPVVALVLAAGFGRRFGSDKRQATLADGRTLLQATLASVAEVYSAVFVVLRETDDPRQLGVTEPVGVVRAANAGRGLGASLADGVSALQLAGIEAEALAVVLGDMPWIAQSSHRRLARLATHDRILRPIYNGRSGHPVLFGRDFWPRLQGLDGDEGARAVLQLQPQACMRVELSDPNIIRDVDTVAGLACEPEPVDSKALLSE